MTIPLSPGFSGFIESNLWHLPMSHVRLGIFLVNTNNTDTLRLLPQSTYVNIKKLPEASYRKPIALHRSSSSLLQQSLIIHLQRTLTSHQNHEFFWLVVWTPLKNMKVNWDDYSQYMGKWKMATKPPTSFHFLILTNACTLGLCPPWIPVREQGGLNMSGPATWLVYLVDPWLTHENW